jgi:hypothetical protein
MMMIGFAHGIVVPIVVDLYHSPDRCPDHHRTPMTDAGCDDRVKQVREVLKKLAFEGSEE